MRKFLKNDILNLLQTLYEAHNEVNKFINKKDFESAKVVLVDLQNAAVQIGTVIESSEGKDFVTLKYLADYCKAVFEISQNMSEKFINKGLRKILDNSLIGVEKSIKNDIKVKLELAFFPYKCSMIDSLSTIWEAALQDESCDVYIVPIPYYDRNPDHSLGKFHYEGNDYPDYVPVTDYRKYDYKARRPDIVYIHNPYDDCNYVTCVHPDYHSSEIKKYTDCLVYVPYFVLQEISPENKAAIKDMEHFCLSPGVFNADKVIVQSEDMRQIYINVLLEHMGNTPANRIMLENKILGLGSPKFDKVVGACNENVDIPDDWKKIIYKSDGSKKNVIFYNTGISGLLNNKELWIKKIIDVLNYFKNINNEVALLWRPHPLIRSTIASMLPVFLDIYDNIVKNYIADGCGIYDDTADLNRAISLSCAYYGDGSSVVQLFEKTGKPIMIQDCNSLS